MRDIVMEKARKVGAILNNPLAVKKVDLEANHNDTRVVKIRAKLKDKNKTESIMKVFQANLGCTHGCASNSAVSADKKKGIVIIDGTKVRDKLMFDLVVGLIFEENDMFEKERKRDSNNLSDIPPEALFLIMGAIEEMGKASKKV